MAWSCEPRPRVPASRRTGSGRRSDARPAGRTANTIRSHTATPPIGRLVGAAPVGRWRGSWDQVLFQRPPVRTRRASCPGNGLSSDCYVSVSAGLRWWMLSWQVGHTIKVLRRILAISCAHTGCGRPGVTSWASLDTWCTCTWDRCSHSSHRPLRRRASNSLPGRRPVSGAGWRACHAGTGRRLRRWRCAWPRDVALRRG
jgi:hypothetical protein